MAPGSLVIAVLFAIFASCLPLVRGGCCPNACSGHGSCSTSDVCTCYANWQNGEDSTEGGDCGSRSCPFELAWADSPSAEGSYHRYAECANKGVCDRETGDCVCFEGYTGKACQRTTCPNDCSGHGICKAVNDVPYGVTANDYNTDSGETATTVAEAIGMTNFADPVKIAYYNWDADRSSMCVCDAGFEGVDCSLRKCPHGSDVVADGTTGQTQIIALYATGGTSADWLASPDEFALSFVSKLGERYTTAAITLDTSVATTALATAVNNALEALPHNVIDGVTVAVEYDSGDSTSPGGSSYLGSTAPDVAIEITFTGDNVQGPQHLLEFEWKPCSADGCTPLMTGVSALATNSDSSALAPYSVVYQISASDMSSLSCGGRGKCDSELGQCNCFSGYYGAHCEQITALV